MNKKVLDFLKKNNVGVLTTLLKNGSPHSATLHYSHQDSPLELFFSTENTSRKCQALLKGGVVKASFVVGFNEEEMITLQMEGTSKLVRGDKELTNTHKTHYKKHPGAEKWKDDPATVFLAFKPKWWRYTEYKPKFFSLESK